MKPFISYIVALIFISATAFFIGCKHDKPPVPLDRTIPADMKSYWTFKPGTYWIYQDTVTGKLDSVYVTLFTNDRFTSALVAHPDITANCEELELDTYGTLQSSTYKYRINTAYANINIPEFT